jgi:hypothetical protein
MDLAPGDRVASTLWRHALRASAVMNKSDAGMALDSFVAAWPKDGAACGAGPPHVRAPGSVMPAATRAMSVLVPAIPASTAAAAIHAAGPGLPVATMDSAAATMDGVFRPAASMAIGCTARVRDGIPHAAAARIMASASTAVGTPMDDGGRGALIGTAPWRD